MQWTKKFWKIKFKKKKNKLEFVYKHKAVPNMFFVMSIAQYKMIQWFVQKMCNYQSTEGSIHFFFSLRADCGDDWHQSTEGGILLFF